MKNILLLDLKHQSSILNNLTRRTLSKSWLKFIIICLAVLLSSCYSSQSLDYLQSDQYKYDTQMQTTPYIVQPNDVLDIKVQSMDPEQVNFFNLNNVDNWRQDANPANLFLTGYSIDKEGMINMAMIGKLKVSGMTLEEIRALVQSEIDELLLNATVSVRLTSFKISVLGDVKNPGTRYVYNTQSTIFEALSAAGDLNISAKRHNVKLIRQEGDKSTVVNLDLTNPSIISSPYYLMHPNDVVYVETSKPNIVRNNLSVFSIILSAVATSLLVFDVVSSN